MGAQPPPIPYILGEGVNYLTLRVKFYNNECNRRRDANPNPNQCNSTLASGTRRIYPHRYILMLMSGVTAYVFPRASALTFYIVNSLLQGRFSSVCVS